MGSSVVLIAAAAAAFLLLVWFVGCSDLESDREALLRFREKADLNQTLGTNWTGNNPCAAAWVGVACNPNGRVYRLTLENRRLTGELGKDLGQLTELRILSLKGNNLTGGIPSDLSSCRGLKKLYLNSNLFHGPIPEAILTLHDLDRMDVSNNRLSGEIPATIAGLHNLLTLRLERNFLTGKLPDVSKIANLTDFNVSWNNVSGAIPSGMASRYPTAFFGNPALCGPPVSASCPPEAKRKKPALETAVIIGLAVSGAVAVLVLALFLVYRCMGSSKKKEVFDAAAAAAAEKKSFPSSEIVFVAREGNNFQLSDLLQASAVLLGKGSLGSTYRAMCAGGFIAVKRLVDRTGCSKKVFERRMAVLGRMTHPNLLRLRAYYFYAKLEKLLVHDYMPKGSLHSVMHGDKQVGLSWSKRLQIAAGVARCLRFLHHQCKLPHGNIKSSNVLLTDEYEARVADFGLLPFVPSDQALDKNGYSAPECHTTGDVSRKADVYSFGVLLLELLTGKVPNGSRETSEETSASSEVARNSTSAKPDLPSWVIATVNDQWSNVFDSAMDVSKQEQMVGLLKIAMLCINRTADERPKMAQVVRMIEEEVEAIDVSTDLSYI